ncbi:MAG: hypothetical protein ACTHN4_10740 [Sphingomicrobium sp.]
MRSVVPFILMAALAGCAAPSPQASAMAQAKAQAKLNQLLAGKVPGHPQACLASYRANDMIVVDDYTIAFRDGTNRVWINKPAGGCNLLSAGPYALVTRNTGGMGLCRGDIAQVVDTLSRSQVGSCVLNDFVPYMTPGR